MEFHANNRQRIPVLKSGLYKIALAICPLPLTKMKVWRLIAPMVVATCAMTFVPPWLTLPSTPQLPPSNYEGHALVNNISLWYALYGPPVGMAGPPVGMAGPPVVLLHGGKISSRWWSNLIEDLKPSFSVIAIDTRAHGRSTDDLSIALSYDLFARDAIALLDVLKIPHASFVGWSDGANTALDIAMNYSSRADCIIAFGANFNPSQANTTGIEAMPFLMDLLHREETEYNEMNPHPDWSLFSDRVNHMQSVSPVWNQTAFDTIPPFGVVRPAPMILCTDADHEEVVTKSTVFQLSDMVCIWSQLQHSWKI
jgi:pimeloyl-ACP methyl ester carboxylesterase